MLVFFKQTFLKTFVIQEHPIIYTVESYEDCFLSN